MSLQTGAMIASDTSLPGQDLSGGRRFVVKVQVPMTGGGGGRPLLIYDERRVVQTFAESPQLAAAVQRLARGVPKAYFWAVREGDRLRISTDCAAPTPSW